MLTIYSSQSFGGFDGSGEMEKPVVPAAPRSAIMGVFVVITAFLVYVPVAGFSQSFGVFVEMFDRDFCRPHDCLDLLGLVSALALSNFRLLCWLQTLLERWFSVPTLFGVGALLCFLSMILTSYVNSVEFLLLTHSFLYGFGSTFMLNAPLTAIDHYFPEGHRFHILASGIINLGPSVGVVVMNPLSVYLDTHELYSWRDTLKIFAVSIFVFAALHMLVLAKTYYNCGKNLEEKSGYEELNDSQSDGHTSASGDKTQWSEWSPWTWGTWASTAWLIAMFLVSTVLFLPKTMFMNYLVQQGITLETSSLILAMSGVTETIMSLFISFTGDFLDRHLLLVFMATTTILSAFTGLLPFVSGQTVLGSYCLVHGACDGLLMTVLFGVTSLVAPPGSSHGVLWSLTNLVIGLGLIAGLPTAGFVFDIDESFDIIFMTAAAIYAVCACLFGGAFAYLTIRQGKTEDYKQQTVENTETTEQ